jgi:hypothetical protein
MSIRSMAVAVLLLVATEGCTAPAPDEQLDSPQPQSVEVAAQLPVGGQVIVHRRNARGAGHLVISSVVQLLGPDGNLHSGRFVVTTITTPSGDGVSSGGHWVDALKAEKFGGGGGGASIFVQPRPGLFWGMVRDETDLLLTGAVIADSIADP